MCLFRHHAARNKKQPDDADDQRSLALSVDDGEATDAHAPADLQDLRDAGWEIESIFEGEDKREPENVETVSLGEDAEQKVVYMTPEAKRFAMGAIDYLAAEMLDIAGNSANIQKKRRIEPRNVQLAIRCDEEINRLFLHKAVGIDGIKTSGLFDPKEMFKVHFWRKFERRCLKEGEEPNSAAAQSLIELWKQKRTNAELGEDDLVVDYDSEEDSDVYTDSEESFEGVSEAPPSPMGMATLERPNDTDNVADNHKRDRELEL